MAATALVATMEVFIVPREIAARFVHERWHIYVLVLGAVATGMLRIIQGALVRKLGAARTFYPISAVNLAFALFLLLDRMIGPSGLLAVYVAAQVMSLVAFLAINPPALDMLLNASAKAAKSVEIGASWESLSFGAIHAFALISYFVFREIWSHHVDQDVAKNAFFVLRISEILMGIFFIVLANSSFLPRFHYSVTRVEILAKIGTALVFLAALSLAAIWLLILAQGAIPLVLLCITLQLMCEGPRIISSVATLYELQFGTPLRFFLIAIPPYFIAGSAALQLEISQPLFSFYLFLILFPILQIATALATRAVYALRTQP
jgi:hypothetical protein